MCYDDNLEKCSCLFHILKRMPSYEGVILYLLLSSSLNGVNIGSLLGDTFFNNV